MTKRMKKSVLICGSSMLIAIYGSGCNCKKDCDTKPNRVAGEVFRPTDEIRDTERFTHAQAASGARHDAELSAYHFDGDKLNSLGEQKFDLMVDDDDAIEPMTVYLNLAATDDHKSARQDAVVAYAKAKGMTESQVKFVLGTNPGTNTPAAPSLANLKKTESGGNGDMGSAMGSAPSESK